MQINNHIGGAGEDQSLLLGAVFSQAGAPDPQEHPAQFDPLTKLAEFECRFPEILALFKEVGIHPQFSGQILNPYTGQLCAENFTNIGEHCLAVAFCASKIADGLVARGLLTAPEADRIVERALAHDLNKPYEIMRRNAVKAGLLQDAYSQSAYDQLRPILESHGVSAELCGYIEHAGKETGHNSLRDFIIVGTGTTIGLCDDKIAEKVVHLADDMTSTSKPLANERPVTSYVTPAERLQAPDFFVKYPWMWQEGLAVDEGGVLVAIKDVSAPAAGLTPLGHYADLQARVGNLMARQIQLMLDPGSTVDPAQFLLSIVVS